MSAVDLLSQPLSRDAQLAKAASVGRRWIDAMPASQRGPLWDVLSQACDDASILGLGDHSFETFVKNAKRYAAYLDETGTPQARAFDKQVVRAYQRYVAALRMTGNVPPAQEGKPLTEKAKPIRRAAQGNEPRLAIKTQKDILDAVRLLHRAAGDQDAMSFSPLPEVSPTADLKWRDEEERDPVRIELDLATMLGARYVPAKGRSRCDFERNLLLAHFYAAIPTRNAELRESVWEALQVWEVAPLATLPLRRWPIEALLSGEVSLDETHVMFLTLGGAVPTKSDTFRSVPIVGALTERVQKYARLWVRTQLEALDYLRYRSRRNLAGALRAASFDVEAVELLIAGERLSVELLADFDLFKRAHLLVGPGVVRHAGRMEKVTPDEAKSLRDVVWAKAAQRRYEGALAAFETKKPVGDVFSGVFLASREGGVLSDAQLQKIWRDMGWSSNGWQSQHLRAHAAQLFEAAHLAALRPLGATIGHKEPTTTALNYTGGSPYRDVVVAEMIARELTMGSDHDRPTTTVAA